MAKFIKKGAKPLTYAMIIFAAIFLVIALVFMDNYCNLAIEYVNGVIKADGAPSYLFPTIQPAEDDLFGVATIDPFWKVVENVYFSLQSINNTILAFAIVVALMFVALALFSNHNRQKYYISNLVVSYIVSIVGIIFGIVIIANISSVLSTFNANYDNLAKFSLLKQYSEGAYQVYEAAGTVEQHYELSSFTMIFTEIMIILFMIYCVLYSVYSTARFAMNNRKAGM